MYYSLRVTHGIVALYLSMWNVLSEIQCLLKNYPQSNNLSLIEFLALE